MKEKKYAKAYKLLSKAKKIKKYIDELKKEGMVELKCFDISNKEEIIPPY